jgi:hypothetical protein
VRITTDNLKVPTAAQVAKRVDELVAEGERNRLEQLRAQYEARAVAELTAELNRGRVDTILAEQYRAAGMTFVRDVWPDHPAAGHVIGDRLGTVNGQRPAGVRYPFRLTETGVWFCDYWVCSPVFPAGRAPDGALFLAFLVDGTWRQALAAAPEANTVGGSITAGFAELRARGLRLNPEPLRGRPEHEPEPATAGVFGDMPAVDYADQISATGTVRYAADLLWRFVNATQNEAPWDLPAS